MCGVKKGCTLLEKVSLKHFATPLFFDIFRLIFPFGVPYNYLLLGRLNQ